MKRTPERYWPCQYCGGRNPVGSLICRECMQTVNACRSALRLLLRDRYIEQVSDHCWMFKPGAQRIAQVIHDATDGFAVPVQRDKARHE